ncbi:MAG: ABC transporter ATP-binding protein [Chloroflexi bacterium]|nr:ABC transporter ATP-binding protein [Chloroflexota bacterium]MDA8187337.1 ABC transporter ATP-binding protein [Dehalococcoidales bacterium]
MTALLQVKDLRTSFFTPEGEVKAVDGVSFCICPGEALAVVGESGCGKSVTSLSIMRLIPHPPGHILGGQILFDGRDLLKLNDREMRRIRGKEIATIFQDPMTSLNPVLTIRRQITESLELHLGMNAQQARQRSVELLKMVGIPCPEQRIDDYPHQFSGGMRQRVMIAIALACSPRSIIADEPTTALDVTIQAQIVNLLEDLQDSFHLTYLFIAHDLSVVCHISDRVAVMYLGKIVELADRDSLYKQPLHPYTRALLSAIPIPDPVAEEKRERIILTGDVPSPVNPPPGCRFRQRCPLAFGHCQDEEPEFRNLGDEHWVACYRAA